MSEREPTSAEIAWQQKRAETTAAYNKRKADREARRAARDRGEHVDWRQQPQNPAAQNQGNNAQPQNPAPNPVANPVANPAPNPVPNQVQANAEVLALKGELAAQKAEVQKLAAELVALKSRQAYTIKFPDEAGEAKEYVPGFDTNIVFTPSEDNPDQILVDVYYC